MTLNKIECIDAIVRNFNNYFTDNKELITKNNIKFEKNDILYFIERLYFSMHYKNSTNIGSIRYYLEYFDLSLEEFYQMEKKVFSSDYSMILPEAKPILYFLSNKDINQVLKVNFLEKFRDKISLDLWYSIIVESMGRRELSLIEDFIYKYCDIKSFEFTEKENFFNLIVLGKISSIYAGRLNKKESVAYIKSLNRLGFDINNKGISVSPLENAINQKEKSMLSSIIALKPDCDFFVNGQHIWDIYLSKYFQRGMLMPYEYNGNVYNYFAKNVSTQSLFMFNEKSYVLGKILRKSNCDCTTTLLIRKHFSRIYEKECELSIRDCILNNSKLQKRFYEMESRLTQEKFSKSASSKKSEIKEFEVKRVRI